MSYIKIRFGSNLENLGAGLDRSIEDIFRHMRPMFTLAERKWKPQMDIYETDSEVIILAEIAGVEKENLELEISTKAIRIHGRRNGIAPAKNATYRLAEVQYGEFERVLFLPVPIDTDKVSASYNNGFLQVNLAKVPPDDSVHRVMIQDD